MNKTEALHLLSRAFNRRFVSIPHFYLSILYRTNMYDLALDYVRKMLLKSPGFDLFCWGGLICYFKRDLNGALRYFEKALSVEDAQEISYFLGEIYLELMEFEKAEKNYASIVDNPALKAKAMYGLALCKIEKNQHREALKLLNDALTEAKSADYVKIQNKKGLCLMEMGLLEEAKACFYDCLNRAPGDNNAKLNLALALSKSGEYEKAINLYKSALSRFPHDIIAINNLALCLAASGRYDEALEYCERGLAMDPLNGDLLINKGYCLYKLADYKKAIDCFKEAEKHVKDDFVVKNNMALCLMALKKYGEALQLLEDVLQKQRSDDILINKAFCLLKMGLYQEAAECYKELETRIANKADIYTMLGICFEKMGETEKAVEYYNKALIA
ncbi:tetratricopeptide repeat protein [Thermosediminibacter oceani]|uniref:TPR repeat-containing protein n=1 Tax=Thermosediminibacter oceani (strain ATCC BAA-1034 / DSM 16646 / JW/IW-1228P) TaxID=555079 RepID=D9S3E9_THEOJ|nr:tetratricopeptide repeat protein [Thermosediminibacter oceani]ADL07926.1 TPR repeat-containing protein [Thermosediminibacter oceani DSM 16646]